MVVESGQPARFPAATRLGAAHLLDVVFGFCMFCDYIITLCFPVVYKRYFGLVPIEPSTHPTRQISLHL